MNKGLLRPPSITKAIIMGLKVEPRITHTSQSNRGTQWHIPRYRDLCPRKPEPPFPFLEADEPCDEEEDGCDKRDDPPRQDSVCKMLPICC